MVCCQLEDLINMEYIYQSSGTVLILKAFHRDLPKSGLFELNRSFFGRITPTEICAQKLFNSVLIN